MPPTAKYSIKKGHFDKNEGRSDVWFWFPAIYSYRSGLGPRFRITRVYIGWLKWGVMVRKVWSNPHPPTE